MFNYISDKYGNEMFEATADEINEMQAQCRDIFSDDSITFDLVVSADGDYYIDQDGEKVFEEVK